MVGLRGVAVASRTTLGTEGRRQRARVRRTRAQVRAAARRSGRRIRTSRRRVVRRAEREGGLALI